MNLPGLYRVTCLRRASDSGHYTCIYFGSSFGFNIPISRTIFLYGVQEDRGIFKTIFHI